MDIGQPGHWTALYTRAGAGALGGTIRRDSWTVWTLDSLDSWALWAPLLARAGAGALAWALWTLGAQSRPYSRTRTRTGKTPQSWAVLIGQFGQFGRRTPEALPTIRRPADPSGRYAKALTSFHGITARSARLRDIYNAFLHAHRLQHTVFTGWGSEYAIRPFSGCISAAYLLTSVHELAQELAEGSP